MDRETLISGYQNIMTTIYSHKQFYNRVKIFLKEYKPPRRKRISQVQFWHIRALVRSMWFLGVKEGGRRYYWRSFVSSLVKHPRAFPLFISLAVYGFHFRKVAAKRMGAPVGDAPA